MIFTHHLADDTGGFLVGSVGVAAHIVHAEQDAPVDGFQAVAGIGQGARHDHAHGVIQVRRAHGVVNVDRINSSDIHRYHYPVITLFVVSLDSSDNRFRGFSQAVLVL